MNANQSNAINSLAQAIQWASSSFWASQYEDMKDNALANIERALERIAEAEAMLKEMREELMSK